MLIFLCILSHFYTKTFVHLSSLFDFMCSPHLELVTQYELLNKGNAAKMGMIWNTINVILYLPQAEKIVFLFFVFYPF